MHQPLTITNKEGMSISNGEIVHRAGATAHG